MEKDDVIKVTSECHILKTPMTEDEHEQEQQTLLRTLQQVDDLVLEKKSAMSEFKSRADRLTQTVEDSRVRLREKAIMKAVDCELTMNLTRLTATLTRKDTGEVVNQRPMTQEERALVQQPTFWEEGDPDDKTVDTPDGPVPTDPVIGGDEPRADDHDGDISEIVTEFEPDPTEVPDDPTATPDAHPDEVEDDDEDFTEFDFLKD